MIQEQKMIKMNSFLCELSNMVMYSGELQVLKYQAERERGRWRQLRDQSILYIPHIKGI